MSLIRRVELNRRRIRREKLAKLRDRYQKAKTEAEKASIREKVSKIAPWLSMDQFLLTATTENKAKK
jgi:hypothetical protein